MLRPIVGTFALSLLFTAAALHAQEATPPPLSPSQPIPTPEPEVALDELIRLALENNPQPAIARANLMAARERANALRSFPNPVLQAAPGVSGTRESRDEELILSQPLDVFGQRRAQRGVAQAQARRAEAEATLTTRLLVAEVKNAAANLLAAQEGESLAQSQSEVAFLFWNAATRRANQGDVPQVQAQRAQLERDRALNELENARAERLASRAALNLLIGRAPETPLRVALPISPAALATLNSLRITAPGIRTGWPTGLGETSADLYREVMPEIITPETTVEVLPQADNTTRRSEILAGALQRPDILSAQAALEANRAQVNAIGRQRLPELSIQARRDGITDSASGTSLRAVVTVPLFDFGSIKRSKRAAQAEVIAQEAQLALTRQRATLQVEQALIRLDQQRATLERYRTAIVPQTLDLLRKTQIGYAQGASTYLEVLEAQRATRQAQNEYLQALIGVRTSEAALEAAYGAALPDSLAGTIGSPSTPAATTTSPAVSSSSATTPNFNTPPASGVTPAVNGR